MTTHRPLLLLASIALATSALGACSKGANSPTEPAFGFDASSKAMASSDLGSAGGDDTDKGRDDDDGSADDNGGSGGGRGRGSDDGTAGNGGNRRGRGNDDGNADNQRRNRGRNGRGRGGNDRPNPQPTPSPTPGAPRAGQQFEAAVQSVNGDTITLVTGQRVVVNGQTAWAARGDLHSLADVAASLAANRSPRVEGRGNRQADGSIVALTIKGEHIGD